MIFVSFRCMGRTIRQKRWRHRLLVNGNVKKLMADAQKQSTGHCTSIGWCWLLYHYDDEFVIHRSSPSSSNRIHSRILIISPATYWRSRIGRKLRRFFLLVLRCYGNQPSPQISYTQTENTLRLSLGSGINTSTIWLITVNRICSDV